MQIRNWLFTVLSVLIVPLCFAGCNDEPTDNYINIGWIEVAEDCTHISMALESQTTFQINYTVVPSNANNKKVSFSSGDKNVVTVDDSGVITAKGVGETLVTIRADENSSIYSTVRVNVLASKQQLNTPTGLRYDATSGKIVWNPVTVTNSSYIPSYKIKMTVNDVEYVETVSTASYEVGESDVVYRDVAVAAVGNATMYDTSQYSTPIEFAQISTPDEIEIVTTTATRSYERAYQLRFKMSGLTDSIEDYDVDIRNLTSGALSKADEDLWKAALLPEAVSYLNGHCYITIPNELSRATFGVRIMAKSNTTLGYFGSNYSTAVQFARLTAPENLTLSQLNDAQILTWSSVRYATGYTILFEYSMLSGSTLTLTHFVSANSENPTSFDISGLENKPSDADYSDYSIYIYAVGTDDFVSGVRYIDSARSAAPATKQLATVSWVRFEKDTTDSVYHIEWSAVDNARTYAVYVAPTTEGNYSSAISQEYDRLVYLGTGARFDSSGMQVDGLGCDIGFTQTVQLNGRNVPVWTVGYNNIKIVAYPGDSVSSDSVEGYSPSNTYVHYESFIKLATPTNFKVSAGKLVWDSVDYAGQYLIDFNNGKSEAKVTSNGTASYEYSPSEPKSGESGSGTGDMPVAGQIYNVTMRATNEGIAYIDSDETAPISASRYAAPAEIKVVDGNLTWSRTDITGSPINAEWFEVRVKRNGEEVRRFETNMSVSITEQLAQISGDNREFEFSVRAINTSTTGNYPYINGWWSESKSVNTYQLPTPKNVRVEDGVIKWDAFSDENIAAGHTGIRFVLMVGSQKYGLSGSTILTINSTQAIIPSLPANSTTFEIKMQTVIESASAGDYGITTGPDTYIINSGYTDSFSVRQLPVATNVTVRDTTLFWTASNASLNKYRVELYRINVDSTGTIRTREDTPVMTAVVEPYDANNPCWNFGLDFGIETTSVEQSGNVVEFTSFVFGAGAYQFVVYAVGSETFTAQNDKRTFGYLTSYESSAVEIYKLEVPTLDVDNGVVRWSSVSSNLGGIATSVTQYTLTVSCSAGSQDITVDGTSSALDALPASFYNLELSIRIKALSSWSRVFDSELSAIYIRPSTDSEYSTDVNIVQKQPKILIDTELNSSYISLDGRKVAWLDSNTDNRSYYIQVSKKDSVNGSNVYSTGSTSETVFEIPDVSGGNYFLNIMRRGYVTEQQGADYKLVYRRLNSSYSDNIYIYRFYKPINLDITRNGDNNPVLKWATGSSSVDERMRFRIAITHIPDGGTAMTDYYYVPHNVVELDLVNGIVYKEDGTTTQITNYSAGMLSITVQAVRARDSSGALITRGFEATTGNLVHFMDGQESAPCIAYIYKAPDITFENGLINLNKSTSNVLDKGTELIFTPVTYNSANDNYVLDESGKEYISVKAKVNTYDMGDLTEGVKYRVQLRALGDTKYNITSSWEDCGFLIEKLAPLNANTVSGAIDNFESFDGWYLRDGEVFWPARTGASQYVAQVTNGSVTRTAFEIDADSTTVTYSSAIASLEAGDYDLQFTVTGGKTDNLVSVAGVQGQYTLSYVTSRLSTAQQITKLYAPNNINVSGRSAAYSRVVDGEFDWGIRDENNAWKDAYGVTKYLVNVNDADYFEFDIDGTARYFDAKSIFDTKGEYIIKVYSIGNTWTGTGDSGAPCVTSDAYGQFTIIYAGEDYNLRVEDGKLNWNATSNGTNSGYELQYELENDADYRTHSTKVVTNTYSFDGINEAGCAFNAIRVRYSGDAFTASGALSGHVNTSWSLDVTDIIKLPDINYDSVQGYMYVNEWGQLAWNYGAYYDNAPYNGLDLSMHLWLDIRYQGVSVGGNSMGVNISKASGSVYDVVAVDISDEDILSALLSAGKDGSLMGAGILKYNFYGYVTVEGSTTYLNSDTYERDAYKLDDPTSFTIDTINGPSLRLNWDISECGVMGYDPDYADGAGGTIGVNGDKILFAYRLNGSTTLQYKTLSYVDLVGEVALWKVGFYDEIRLIVLNTAGQAFGSDPLILENIGFEYFESGCGTGVDPFVIKDHDSVSALYQLELVYWLPEMYFKLGQDVALEDLAVIQSSNRSATSNFPVPSNLNASAVDARYKELKFTGGFDGAGYTILNFQTAGAESFGWWNSVEYNIPTDLSSVGENYNNIGGIIKNLTIEANSIDVSMLTENSYSGLFTKENYGWIINCNSIGAEKSDADGYKVEVVSGKINAAEVFVGGIAGVVGCYEETVEGVTNYLGSGRIEGCNNMLNIKLSSADNTNHKSIVGGIVAYNFLGLVIDCSNGREVMTDFNTAQVSGYEVGGIVGRVSGVEITSSEGEKSYTYARVSGCVNYGTVTSVSIVSDDVESCVSGGIAGNVKIGFVTYSINYGEITSTGYYPIIGGVVGYTYGGGFVLSCINIGNVRGYVYYSYNSASDNVAANPVMGSLIGTAYADSNLRYSYHVANKVQLVDNSVTGDNTTFSTQAIGYSSITAIGVDSVNDFKTFSERDRATCLAALNQTTILINGESVTYAYPRIDMLIAEFSITLGSNPTISWVQYTGTE